MNSKEQIQKELGKLTDTDLEKIKALALNLQMIINTREIDETLLKHIRNSGVELLIIYESIMAKMIRIYKRSSLEE